MTQLRKRGTVAQAAMAVGIDRKTVRKYRDLGKLPSEVRAEGEPRSWRTREDPFVDDWPRILAMLEDAPELQAKTIFELLQREQPGAYADGQVRTLQRRIKAWRAQAGPPRNVFFPQRHIPGEAMQTDFTRAAVLGVTIGGEVFPHLICQVCLPYSNWSWPTVCRSESMMALRRGLQSALISLGAKPRYHQTDNSTGATHDLKSEERRGYNEDYLALMRHYDLKPRTTAIGAKEQNGDIESAHNALKNRVRQHLLLRGHSDFESVEEYERWLQNIATQANVSRRKRLDDELRVMRSLTCKPLPEHDEIKVRVTSYATIRVKNNTYSVPSRLIGEQVHVHISDARIEVFHGGKRQLAIDRLLGEGRHRINYRHVIHALVRKPGAFKRYRFRDDFFPTQSFRTAYEALTESLRTVYAADLAYLRLLAFAAETMECEVEAAIDLLLDEGIMPTPERVQELLSIEPIALTEQGPKPFTVSLADYDALLVATVVTTADDECVHSKSALNSAPAASKRELEVAS